MKIFYTFLMFSFLTGVSSPLAAGAKLKKKLETQNFFASYEKYLEAKKIDTSSGKWDEEEIQSLDLIPDAARPNRPFYNNTILWYSFKNKKIGFRPFDTTTGCDTGCSPLTFHLVIDVKGNTQEILEETGIPLRKTYHIPLSKEDKKKLLFLCQQFPTKLEYIDSPKDLTDNHSSFPPQTHTFFKDSLIVGGAYTTAQVVLNAKRTKDYLFPNTTIKDLEKKERNQLVKVFEKPITTSKAFLQTADELNKLLVNAKTVYIKKKLVDNILQAVIYAINKDIVAPGSTREKTLATLVEKHLNPFENYLNGSMQSIFQSFMSKLLYSDDGREFLLILQNKLNFWKKLPETFRVYLPLLARGYAGDKNFLKKHESEFSDTKLFGFASQNSFFLYSFIKASESLGKDRLFARAYGRLKARYPKTKFIEKIKVTKKLELEVEKQTSKEMHLHTKTLLREFSKSKAKVPQMTGTLAFGKGKKVTLPQEKDHKQIYIFFAPWCSHCLHLIEQLGQTMNRSFWKKTQLIAVFSDDTKMISEFIERTKLKERAPKAVEELVMLGEDAEAQKIYNEKLYIYAVPKVIVTDKEGKIINFSFTNLEPSPEEDSQRDLDLILAHF